MRILLVEDDLSLQNGISFKLNKEGNEVACADTVEGALSLLNNGNFHMAILDISLPDGSGLDLCRRIRQTAPATHILFLTAKDTETDIIMGYDIGADDYLTKPFSISVLLSKCNAVARRIETDPSTGTISLDTSRQSAYVRGTAVLLTRNELRLLNLLLRNAGQIVTKERLLQELWDANGEFVDENTLAVNIRRLREKVERDPSRPSFIETVRGVGYRLNGDV
ncbi:DNA-binding response OmpR family regulator [Anaerotaenia torta]|uniref:response regulator transcription factor n=1 Tax=Anaerotaenia torta TaxID=433293 RepID=UPI003D1B4BB2